MGTWDGLSVEKLAAHVEWMRSLARGMAGDAHDADDLVQEAWLVALQKEPRRGGSPESWLAAVLRNLSLHARRERRRRAERERRAAKDEATPDPAALADEVALQRDVATAVLRLDEPYRSALLLHYYAGKTAVEIARDTGATDAAVRQRLRRAREQLREQLGRDRTQALLALAAHRPEWLAPTIGGAVVKKSVFIAAAIALTCFFGWWAASRGAFEAPPASVDSAQVGRSSAPSTGFESVPSSREPTTGDSTTVARRSAVDRGAHPTGRLEVLARHAQGGEPASGALVIVRRQATGREPLDLEARTDANGRATFERLPIGALEVGLLRGDLVLARAAIAADETTSIELEQHAGVTVLGEVVDPTGAAVPGAEIWVSERSPEVERAHRLEITDATGRFQLTAIHENHSVFVRAHGYEPTVPVWLHGEPSDQIPLRFVLQHAGPTVRGLVVDATGRPVAAASVLIGAGWRGRMYLDPSDEGRNPASIVVTTDENGAFESSSVPVGSHPVIVRAPGFAVQRGVIDASAVTTFQLEAQARIEGRVSDVQGKSAAGVHVRVACERPFEACEDVSDDEGRFELAGFALGEASVTALRAADRAWTKLTIGAGETFEWNPVLESTPAVRGVLLDEHAWPLAGWSVTLSLGGESDREITDDDGRFSFSGSSDAPHRLSIQPRPGASNEFPWLVLENVSPSREELSITVRDPATSRGTLAGRITTPDGRPPHAIAIEIGAADGSWCVVTPGMRSGAFEIERVPAGPCQIDVRSTHYPRRILSEVNIVAGEHTDLGDITLASAGFVVVAVSGIDALDTMRVRAAPRDGGEEIGGFRRLGNSFESPPLEPGPHELRLDGPRIESRWVDFDVRAGERLRLDVATAVAGLRRVRIVAPLDGERPQWCWLELADEHGDPLWIGGQRPSRSERGWIAELTISAKPGAHKAAAGAGGCFGWSGVIEVDAIDAELPVLEVSLKRR